MAKKFCISHAGLNAKQKRDLESRIKKTTEEFNEELESSEPMKEEEEE